MLPPMEATQQSRELEELQYKYAIACYALAYEILEMHWDTETINAFGQILDDVPLDIKNKPQFRHLLFKKKRWIKKHKKKKEHGSA